MRRRLLPILPLLAALALSLGSLGCAEIECATDADCPGDTVCIGSSLCPPDVECVWEGHPGVCRPGQRILCLGTGGIWDDLSCGHYTCGAFPECDAVIPGCDCGPDMNFDRRDGCVPDPACDGACRDDLDCDPWLACIEGTCADPDAVVCEQTGGVWEPTSCGDYHCGLPPLCEAIIPGCDCGPDRNFASGEGCVLDEVCEGACRDDADCDPWLACIDGACGDPDTWRCEQTGGRWDPTSCGHYSCGRPPLCAAVIPGCDCGPTQVFLPGIGCQFEPGCGLL